jgi:hypothetical protein
MTRSYRHGNVANVGSISAASSASGKPFFTMKDIHDYLKSPGAFLASRRRGNYAYVPGPLMEPGSDWWSTLSAQITPKFVRTPTQVDFGGQNLSGL